MRQSQLAGRSRLAGLLGQNKERGEMLAAERERFTRLADPIAAPRVVSSFNLFQTPEPLADRVAGLFDSFGRTLEPSAGLGRLYRAVCRLSDCEMILVDSSPDCCRELRAIATGAEVIERDFLTLAVDGLGRFDSIIMNPPFKMGTDIKHIQHAITLLAPGGRLVSICANGPKQQATLKPIASQWHTLCPSAFRSEGTSVSAAIFVYDT